MLLALCDKMIMTQSKVENVGTDIENLPFIVGRGTLGPTFGLFE